MRKFRIGKHYRKSEKGQSLIEVLIAVAVGTLIVTSLLGLAARSNRNANFARATGQASKLAQQGLEIVRNIETLDQVGSIRNLGTCLGCDNWTDLYGEDLGNPTQFGLVPASSCAPATTWCLDGTSIVESITHDNFNFERTVEMHDTLGQSACHTPAPPVGNGFDYTDSKQVTVKVAWDDPTGSHEVSVATCINKLG